MFHVTFPENRDSIKEHGLLSKLVGTFSKAAMPDDRPRVFLSEEPVDFPEGALDVWHVDMTGLPAYQDSSCTHPGVWVVYRDIEPRRLTLHGRAIH